MLGFFTENHMQPRQGLLPVSSSTVANFKIRSWKDGHVIHSVKLCLVNKLRAKIFVESESAQLQYFVKSESALGCKKKLKVLSVALKLPLFQGLF